MKATKESVFQSIKPDKLFRITHCQNLEYTVNNKLEQIILELTGKCNQSYKNCWN